MQVYFMLRCKCSWFRKCSGTSESYKDLREFKPCSNCHGPRKFKCPKCAQIVKAVRYEEPDPPEMKEEPIPTPKVPRAPRGRPKAACGPPKKRR